MARAAFPRGNPYLAVVDALGPIFASADFADLYPPMGQPGEDPARLALVTLFQFAEGLSDRQAADAVRSRIDWKYALGLPLTDPGFDHTVLAEFRTRLRIGHAELRLFEILLTSLKTHGFVKARGRQRTDSTHVLAAVHVLNRLECVRETLLHALNALAVAVPDWLERVAPASWFERYGPRLRDDRLPRGREERTALAEQIGADGRCLWQQIDAPTSPAWLRELPAVQTLRRLWLEQFYADEPIRWRVAEDLPPAAIKISTPHDSDARCATKGSIAWMGYQVHLTETCEEDLPHLITDVATTPATTVDHALTAQVQERLVKRDVVPSEHLVDAMYVTADHLVNSQQEHACTLLGPAPKDYSWQAREQTGYAVAQFALDWEAKQATCPHGHVSRAWNPGQDSAGHEVIRIRFDPAHCIPCPAHDRCVGHDRARVLKIRPRERFEALRAARERETTDAFKAQYAKRAGIEGTISQGVRRCALRRSRYIGQAKTALGHALAAAALNVVRLAAWLAEEPRAVTRRSAFAKLASRAA